MNKLANESSPYLLQHKDNPVEWWPYSEEAFLEATERNVPVFLSIGYSSCHWCHVLARESFEDEEIAKFMNANFVNIKMDREEYPAVDKIYQELYQLVFRRGGGWPLSVWMTAEKEPFYLGTYFPKEPSHGLSSFKQVITQISEMWNTDELKIRQQASEIKSGLISFQHSLIKTPQEENQPQSLIGETYAALSEKIDSDDGGFGSAPKFPQVSNLKFLFRHSLEKSVELTNFVVFTLEQLVRGGIYDQLAGGWARYSVDKHWLIPHFEKMLYDNALLIQIYAEVYQVTKRDFIKKYSEQTISWLFNELHHESGGFFASLNAESEGEEGKYYVWTLEQIRSVLENEEDPEIFDGVVSHFGISSEGNFRDPHHPEKLGLNVLNTLKTKNYSAHLDKNTKLAKATEMLLSERLKRVRPDLDNKIITSWNALMIEALLTYAITFNDSELLSRTLKELQEIFDKHLEDNIIVRSRVHNNSNSRTIEGSLDDYSYLIKSLVIAYEITGNWSYVTKSELLLKIVLERFYDQQKGVFYHNNPTDRKSVGVDSVQVTDEAIPSALGILVQMLYKLGRYLENEDYLKIGQTVINKLSSLLKVYSSATSTFVEAIEYFEGQYKEILILNQGNITKQLFSKYIPMRLVYYPSLETPDWEILSFREETDDEVIYICENMVCKLPIRTMSDLEQNFEISNLTNN